MKKIKIVVISLCFLTLSLVVFAKPLGLIEQGTCTSPTIFWGSSCCTYTNLWESPTNGVIFEETVQKCCKYRAGIIWNSCSHIGITNPQ